MRETMVWRCNKLIEKVGIAGVVVQYHQENILLDLHAWVPAEVRTSAKATDAEWLCAEWSKTLATEVEAAREADNVGTSTWKPKDNQLRTTS